MRAQTDATPPARMPMPHGEPTTVAEPPGSRIAALATHDADEPVVLSCPGEPVRFDPPPRPTVHGVIFDLWPDRDVTVLADYILDRPRLETLAFDGPWPPGKIDVFQRRVDSGKSL